MTGAWWLMPGDSCLVDWYPVSGNRHSLTGDCCLMPGVHHLMNGAWMTGDWCRWPVTSYWCLVKMTGAWWPVIGQLRLWMLCPSVKMSPIWGLPQAVLPWGVVIPSLVELSSDNLEQEKQDKQLEWLSHYALIWPQTPWMVVIKSRENMRHRSTITRNQKAKFEKR